MSTVRSESTLCNFWFTVFRLCRQWRKKSSSAAVFVDYYYYCCHRSNTILQTNKRHGDSAVLHSCWLWSHCLPIWWWLLSLVLGKTHELCLQFRGGYFRLHFCWPPTRWSMYSRHSRRLALLSTTSHHKRNFLGEAPRNIITGPKPHQGKNRYLYIHSEFSVLRYVWMNIRLCAMTQRFFCFRKKNLYVFQVGDIIFWFRSTTQEKMGRRKEKMARSATTIGNFKVHSGTASRNHVVIDFAGGQTKTTSRERGCSLEKETQQIVSAWETTRSNTRSATNHKTNNSFSLEIIARATSTGSANERDKIHGHSSVQKINLLHFFFLH